MCPRGRKRTAYRAPQARAIQAPAAAPAGDYAVGLPVQGLRRHPPRPSGLQRRDPSYVIWNLIQRYTKENDLVVDPFAGSGTTLDVARDLKRRALGYDVHPARKDIFRVDARKLPP